MTSRAMPVVRAGASAALTRAKPATAVRLAFIDNIRILLVILVVLHHLAVTYGGEGSWYYYEGQADTITAVVLTLFVAVNQAFFMGFYFLIAAYFLPRSLEAKGSKQFLKDRFLRLGIPLAFQLLVIAPLLSYSLAVSAWGFDGSPWTYLGNYVRQYRGLDTGTLWFVEALLIFSIAYALWGGLTRPAAREVRRQGVPPGNLAIAAFALAAGLISFVVRIWLPVGWFFAPLDFQFPHFPQYISLFVVGAIAYRRGWLSAISEDTARGRLWGRIVAFLIAIAPVLFVAGGALQGSTAAFRGGIHWQALTYALWEQFLCVGMVISLLVTFCQRHDHQGELARTLSASAYAVYILHAPILVFVSLGLRSMELHSLVKFALASLISLPICFVVGGVVSRLPVAERILA
jgi:fucose 4-O-acetylase-like acetyltransferase